MNAFRRYLFYLILVLGIFVSVACKRKSETTTPSIRVTGASTVYPIVQMAAEHLKQQGVLKIEAQAGGSTRGFEDTLAGRNHLGAMARDLSPKEAQQVQVYAIAYDGVGIVVHNSNLIKSLQTDDLRRIYRKEIANWSQVGGADLEISVVSKAEGHATLTTFLEHTGLKRSELKVDVVGGDNAQIIRIVSNTKNAIGFVSMGEVIHSIEVGMPLRLIPLDGIEPTLKHVEDKSYPMFRTLYLISKEEAQGGSLALLNFLKTPDGQAIIRRGKYVPL